MLLNNGYGTFDTTITVPGNATYATGIAVDDVNGDGNLDVVVAGPHSNRVWFGDGTGSFVDSGQYLLMPNFGPYGHSVELADVNGDGLVDAIFTDNYPYSSNNYGDVAVFLNQGDGHFIPSYYGAGSWHASAVAVGNLDGDFLTEDRPVTIAASALTANDTDPDSSDSLHVIAIDTAHTDGYVDFNPYYSDGQIYYDPNGQFETLAQGQSQIDTFVYTVSDNHGATSVATVTMVVNGVNDAPEAHDDHLGGFVDTGAHQDIFVAGNSADHVWLNDGAGTFFDSGELLGGDQGRGVALGDLNGDGFLDAFVANNAGPDHVWLNDGTGTFTETAQPLGASDARGVALGDFNEDGHLDAFVVNFNEPDQVWLNDGNGTFAASGQTLAAGAGRDVAVADLERGRPSGRLRREQRGRRPGSAG